MLLVLFLDFGYILSNRYLMKSRVREMLLEEDCESFESLIYPLILIYIYETRKIKLKEEIFSK